MENQQQHVLAHYGALAGSVFASHAVHPQLQQLADVHWKLELSAKLAAILEKLRERFSKSQNVCLCQAWVGADGCEAASSNSLEVTLWADPQLAIVLDPLFQDLRTKSCQGPVFFRNSMPGKVWRSGAVQIVQNLRILPPSLHPRSQLSEEALERLAEALYIPIYDLARPAKGQVCVLEVLLSTRATEAMLVADVISFIGSLLTALHLSLANPIQQPVRRSVLSGRRPRAPDSDGEASGDEPSPTGRPREPSAPQSEPQQQQQQVQAGGPQTRHSTMGHAGPQDPRTEYRQQQCTAHVAPRGPRDSTAAGTGPGTSTGTSGAGPAGSEGWAKIVCGSTPGDRHSGTGDSAGPSAATAEIPALCRVELRPGDAATLAAPCSRAGPEAGPSCSEQPTLPASPSHERGLRAGEGEGCQAGAAPSTAVWAGGAGIPGTHGSVPRKVRKLLDGPMQRSKSVASVVALSNGAADSDEEAEAQAAGGNGTLMLPPSNGAAAGQGQSSGSVK